MATVSCGCCTVEHKLICQIIGWGGILVDVISCAVFSYQLDPHIGTFGSSLAFVIISVLHFIGSISLLLAIKTENKWFFCPWVLVNFAAMIFLLVAAIIWEMYFGLIVETFLLYAQSYVVNYIYVLMKIPQNNPPTV